MEKNLEKSLKRFLKRKVKITLGFIVAFLLSCNFVWAEGIEITQGDNGEILFNGEVYNSETHQFTGNTFENNIYTNNSILKKSNSSGSSYTVDIENFNDNFTFVNNNQIFSSTATSSNNNLAEATGINIITEKGNISILNEGKILTSADCFIDYDTFTAPISTGISILGKMSNNINIINNGTLDINGGYQGQAVYLAGRAEQIKNNGLLSVNNNISEDNQNFGICTHQDIENPAVFTEIENIKNNGIVSIKSYISAGIRLDMAKVEDIENNGKIYGGDETNTGAVYGIEIQNSEVNKIKNNGIIVSQTSGTGQAIRFSQGKVKTLKNNGILYATGENNNYPTINASYIDNTINFGTIIKDTENDKGRGLELSSSNELTNYGIISADNPIYYPPSTGTFPIHKNLGLYLSEEGHILKHKFVEETSSDDRDIYEILKNQDEKIIENNDKIKVTISTGGANNPAETEITIKNESGKTIINAGSDSEGIVQSIKSETIKNLTADKGYILNGYDKTVVLNSATGSKNISNSIINAVKNAVTFDGENLTLGLNNTVVNGGYGENIILGDSNKNSLNISGESIINGNISLDEGNDELSLDNTVQINGILDGGEGEEDTLAFNSSTTKSEDKNINILYDIKNFEKTNIASGVTLFEKTIDSDGNIKKLSAQLGDITIGENGELTLRVDGTEKADGKVTGHALYGNQGSITAENGGKLALNTFGFGENEVIDFKDTDLSNLKDEDINLSSALHDSEIGENNTITVSAKKDLEDLDIANYDKLNKIYHSILNSENVDKFTVAEEQYGAFTKYLHDIYAGNPYAYSSELSRKTMSMMKNLADKDLKPELNKWAIYGGLTHTDGGTENSYYGKGYYTYDIGSRDISADTKISGGYFKAEYGKSDTVTTGIIFGGNNSETEIGASKVEGDSFYFGAYAKKYINDFRFTLGAGFQHGDYKADRTAIGYDGITETRKFSENYHDRGFNIYGNTKYTKELGNGFYFEPSLTLEYSYVDQDGASEDGVLAIETDSKNFDYLSGAVNLDLRKEIKSDKFTHSFIAGVSYERMLSGYDEEYITGRIKGGTDFDILVPEKEKDIFSLNAKYELETEKGFIFDVKGSYRFEHDTDKDEWAVGTGIGYKF